MYIPRLHAYGISKKSHDPYKPSLCAYGINSAGKVMTLNSG